MTPLKSFLEDDGGLLRLRLARPKANIINAEMIAALSAALQEHQELASLRALLIEAEGPHFSFGASVEEHLPAACEKMLKGLHQLIIQLLEFPVPSLVAIQGQCLGGGLELASACNFLFAHPEAALGQPEIKLAVFAPAASCLLPERIGQAQAEDLLFTGRSIDGREAWRLGLVSELNENPAQAALDWYHQHFAECSASSLRHAVRAARAGRIQRLKNKLLEVEKMYLEELMSSRDAVEGLQAFVEKRSAHWEHC